MRMPLNLPQLSNRRLGALVVAAGGLIYIFFAAFLMLSYRSELETRRESIVNHDVPVYVERITRSITYVFDPTRRNLELLASRRDWPALLDEAAENAEFALNRSRSWADIMRVPDVTIVDIRRRTIYPFWSDGGVELDPNLERDAWFFSVWGKPDPPERKITFYYDEQLGGHTFYYDQLVTDETGNPIAVVGASVPLERFIDAMQAILSQGDWIRVYEDSAEPLLEISADDFVYLTDVYDTEGVAEGHTHLSQPSDGQSPAEDRVIRHRISLPLDGMRADINLNVDSRMAIVRRGVRVQFGLLIAAFTLLIGGYIVLIHLYSRRAVHQLTVIAQQRKSIEELLSVLTHNLSNDLLSLRLQLSPPSQTEERRRGATGQPLESLLIDMEQVLQNAIYSARASENVTSQRIVVTETAALFERLEDSCRPVLSGKAQELITVPAAHSVRTDEDILYHILLNLLTNAGKYGPPDSEILLGARDIPKGVEFVIADQGPGFSATDRKLMFTPRKRLSARPTQGERSTGMGLYVSRKLAGMIEASLLLVDGIPNSDEYRDIPTTFEGAVWKVVVPDLDGVA